MNVRALSISLSYPSTSLEYIGCEKRGEMDHEYCFMAAKAKGNIITLDAAVVGTENDGLTKDGIFANVFFKQCYKSNNYDINIQSAKARDNNNHDIQILIGSKEALTSNVPTTYALIQNYPNPFNPSTTINYELSADSYVKLNVFDILGREVVTLINKQQDAGYYQVEWNGRNTQQQLVPSGIYFYQIRAIDPTSNSGHDFISTKKMLLLK